MQDDIKVLAGYVDNVISLLETEYHNELDTEILKTIYEHYVSASEMLHMGNIREVKIGGSVKAFIGTYREYTGPLVAVMDHAETLCDTMQRKIPAKEHVKEV